MIYFDEKSVAEKMHDKQQFMKMFCVSELAVYAKWLRYKKSLDLEKDLENFSDDENATTDKEIERELINFSEKCYPNFNYTVNYVEIDKAIEISRKYKLKLPNPTPITEKEWDKIMSIDNDDYRRVLFVSLVDAKYYSLNHTTIGAEEKEIMRYWNRVSDKDVLKMAKTKLRTAYDKRHVWYYLVQNGFTGISPGRNKVPYVNIVDVESPVIDYITDYEHLDLHYEKLMGERIGCCKHCSRLFRQNKKNNAEYCYKHRGYKKIGLKQLYCIDCGSELFVNPKNNKTTRCIDCQKKFDLERRKIVYNSQK